ncbi:MAG: sulfur transferase domain-containing protein [Moraxella sp.]|uniref:beta-lactamase hydrolase domain-containing protein n=1 Tax=Moraxella sp. TaxID=479 RepID=UPI0026DB2BFF|nr:sulfur transferase domain-containing protein [Moraxella sp.]MDO4450498.1 sulfur transferase domain-containing protein [Moraxella sp.]
MENVITIYKQIYPYQCPALAKLGFKSIINLRPDDEAAGQPKSDELLSSAKREGLSYYHLPFSNEQLHLELVRDFVHVLSDMPKPVLIFCGTGARAKRLYQSAVVSGLL